MDTDRYWKQARKANPAGVALLVAAFFACGLGSFNIETAKYQFNYTWSFADPLCAGLSLITVCVLIRAAMIRKSLTHGMRRFDAPSWWMLAYIGMYILALALNGSWASGSSQNFLRTGTFALMLYVLVRGALRNTKDLGWFFWLSAAFGSLVSINGMQVMASHTDGFSNQLLVLGDLPNSMNQWGFLQVMCLIVTLAWWARSPHALYRALPCVVMVAGIAFSFSRTAYSCLAIALFVTAISAGRKIAKAAIILASAGATMWLVMEHVQESMPQAMNFLANKLDTYQSDFNDTRLVGITANPFIEWTRQPLPLLVFGDGSTVAHNMFINCLWATGAVGLLLMAGYQTALFRNAWKLWRSERKVAPASASLGASLFTLVLTMMLDDSATNFRNHVQTIAYTFAVLAGGLSSPAAWSTMLSSPAAATWRRAAGDRMR